MGFKSQIVTHYNKSTFYSKTDFLGAMRCPLHTFHSQDVSYHKVTPPNGQKWNTDKGLSFQKYDLHEGKKIVF